MELSFDVLRNVCHRTRTEQCVQSDEVFKPARLRLLKNFLHSRRLELEYSNSVAAAEQVECFFIRFAHIACVKFRRAGRSVIINNIFCVADKRKCLELE